MSISPKILSGWIFQDFLSLEDVNYFDRENVNAIGFRSCLIPFINNFEKQNYNQIVAWHAWLYVPLFSTLFHNPPLSFLYSVFQKILYHHNKSKVLCIFDVFSVFFSSEKLKKVKRIASSHSETNFLGLNSQNIFVWLFEYIDLWLIATVAASVISYQTV